MVSLEETSFVLCSTLWIKTDEPVRRRCDTHFEGMLRCLQSRLDLCDVVLIVGDTGKRISAHRLILIASSDYFSALLSGAMSESQQREVTLSEVDGDALEQLVNFCYTGILELRGDTIETLIITAKYLQFNGVVESCCEFLQSYLQPSNCLSIAFFAEQWNFETLLDNTRRFICQNFVETSNYPEFLQLNAKQLSQLIASDDLDVPSEEFVFDVLMKWIEYKPNNRRKHFVELLTLVRLPLMSHTYLTEKVEPLCNTMDSLQLVLNALKSHLTPSSSNCTQHRKCFKNYLLAIYPRHYDQAIIEAYNPYEKKWTTWDTPIENRTDFGVALMDDNLILIGGYSSDGYSSDYSNDTYLNSVVSLNLSTMTFTNMAPMETRRGFHNVAILNGSIYAIGGTAGNHVGINSVERWDPISRLWTSVAPMKVGRVSPMVAVFNGCLYVSGGYCKATYFASVECYDPQQNIWTSKASLKEERSEYDFVVHNGYLYAVGGWKKDPEQDIPIERYDPDADTWIVISCSSSIARNFIKCTTLGSDVYVLSRFHFYMLSTKEDCNDNMKVTILPRAKDTGKAYGFIAIPYGVHLPDSWIQKKEASV